MFIGDDVFKPISALSGGERGRVQLSKIMLAGANFLVLDEPTNHLDIFSKEILEDAIREFSGTVFYISHDRYFINNTATKIMELTANGIKEYFGNYDYYSEKKAQQQPQTATITVQETAAPTNSKEEYLQRKEQEAQARRKKARIEKLEAEISKTEEAIAECEAKLESEEINTNAEAAQAVFEEKTALEEALTALYGEWEESA
jgi:ATP-binding cassette subfamily F protein 3